jgi:hypothetical protein
MKKFLVITTSGLQDQTVEVEADGWDVGPGYLAFFNHVPGQFIQGPNGQVTPAKGYFRAFGQGAWRSVEDAVATRV